MNLFARLAEILVFGLNEPWEKGIDLERVFARNGRDMEQELMDFKRYAAAVVAVERGLAQKLKQHRAKAELCYPRAAELLAAGRESLARRVLVRKRELDELVRRLEIDYSTALGNRERAERTLHTLETRIDEVQGQQRSILIWHRAAAARLDLHRRATAGTAEGRTVQQRLNRLLDELARFEEELIARVETNIAGWEARPGREETLHVHPPPRPG